MSEQDVPDGPISREEMIDLFGEEMPMEAVKLVWEVPGHMTLREVRQELRRIAKRAPQNPRVTLADCPPGLFETREGHWGFKTEYAHKCQRDGRYYPEAYVVDSGEFFWGGATDHPERAKLLVRPLDAEAIRHREAAEAEAKAREAALVEALTPSGDTKAAYHGEFSFQLFRGVSDAGIDQYEKVCVPWTTVKEIMAAISARAALTKEPDA